jgi:hypothetical protein
MTNIFDITYTGTGSDKQVAWASDIFNAEIDRVRTAYDDALRRVADGSMPPAWSAHWESVLSDDRLLKAVETYAKQSASVTISYKGLQGPRGTVSVSALVTKIVNSTYEA